MKFLDFKVVQMRTDFLKLTLYNKAFCHGCPFKIIFSNWKKDEYFSHFYDCSANTGLPPISHKFVFSPCRSQQMCPKNNRLSQLLKSESDSDTILLLNVQISTV